MSETAMTDAEVDAAVLKVLRTLYSFSNNDQLAAERRILWRAAMAAAPTPAPQDEAAKAETQAESWIMAVDQAHGTCLTARIAALACPPRGPQCGDASIGGGNCEAHAAAYKEWDAVRRRMSHG